jgi:hypothetical protein
MADEVGDGWEKVNLSERPISMPTKIFSAVTAPFTSGASLIAGMAERAKTLAVGPPKAPAATTTTPKSLQPPASSPGAKPASRWDDDNQEDGRVRSHTAAFVRMRAPAARRAANDINRLRLKVTALRCMYDSAKGKVRPRFSGICTVWLLTRPLGQLSSWKKLEQEVVPWEKEAAVQCRVCAAALASGPLASSEHCRVCGRCICTACVCSIPLVEFGVPTSADERAARGKAAAGKLLDLSHHVTVGARYLFGFWFVAQLVNEPAAQVCRGHCLEVATPDLVVMDQAIVRLISTHAALSAAIANVAYLAPGLRHLLASRSATDDNISGDEVHEVCFEFN